MSRPSRQAPGFARSTVCAEFMAVVAGASARASLVCDWLMALFAWLSYTGTKRPELDARNLKSSTCFEGESMASVAAKQFFVCVENDGYPASLEKRKIYVALSDVAFGLLQRFFEMLARGGTRGFRRIAVQGLMRKRRLEFLAHEVL